MSALQNSFFKSLSWEFKIQWRQGIILAALFVLVVWVVILAALPLAARELLLPYAIFMDTSVFGIYFMAGMLYLEKDEGVLEALVITPRPRAWYLVTKLISLLLITGVITILLVLAIWRGPVNWFYLLSGTLLNGWLLTMVGFSISARYNSITEFLPPSILILAPSQLPVLGYFGIWDAWPLYLVPTQGAMLLIEGGFTSIESWQVIYSFAILIAASIVATWHAVRTFDRYIVRRRGEEM